MRKIFLINMPFANLILPSIGLTQLKSVVDKTFKDQVSVEIVYLNQDFALYVGGKNPLRRINDSPNANTTGIGDWFFRRSAFPDSPDNQEAYFKRYYPYSDPRTKEFLDFIAEKREHLDDFLDAQIDKYGMGDAFIAGFTSMFSQNVASMAMAKRLKNRNPNIITVMGGANCETPMGKELAKYVEQIDYVFSGPALKSFPQFLQHCLNQEWDKCHTINGVFTKQNCQPRPSLVTIGGCGTVRDIGDELDINADIRLDYEPFLNTYFTNFPNARRPTLMFETSRGCWWGQRSHCTFCGLNGATMAYRVMRPELAVEQINNLFNYAPRVRRYESVDNILDKSYLREVLPKVKTPSDAIIFYETKADLTEEEVQILAKARVKEIQPGVESLATKTLQLMGKGTTVFTNISLLKNCRYYGIIPGWNLLVGFPGEGEEVYKKYLTDIPLLMHLNPPSGVYQVRVDRYSPYFTKAEAYGLQLKPMEFYSYIYPFPEESIPELAYYFTDTNLSAEYLTTMIRWIDRVRQKFNVWQAKWKGVDPANRPLLHFKQEGDTTVVYDSRYDEPVEHHLSAAGIEILKLSAQRQTAKGVAQGLAHLPGIDVDKEIAELNKRGLLFWEGIRFMSLVLPGPPLE